MAGGGQQTPPLAGRPRLKLRAARGARWAVWAGALTLGGRFARGGVPEDLPDGVLAGGLLLTQPGGRLCHPLGCRHGGQRVVVEDWL